MTDRYPCVESTEEFHYRGLQIRLWINQAPEIGHLRDPSNYPENAYMKTRISHFLDSLDFNDPNLMNLVVSWVADGFKGKVNAIQISRSHNDREGGTSGLVAYLVNFADDVHG